MLNLRRAFNRSREHDDGQTMTEFALLLGAVSLAATLGYNGLGNSASAAINAVSAFISSTNPSSPSSPGSDGSIHHHDD